MNLRLSFLYMLLSLLSSCRAQQQTRLYTNFVIAGHRLIVLTKAGTIDVINTDTDMPIDTGIRAGKSFSTLGLGKDDRVYVSTNREIGWIDVNAKRYTKVTEVKDRAFSILFSSSHKCFTITDKGIHDIADEKDYRPDTTLRLNKAAPLWHGTPVAYMDNDDQIWIGFDHGEWGGQLYIFNTKQHQFVKPFLNDFGITVSPVISFFGDGKCVYLTSGLQHMLSSGSIVKSCNNKLNNVFLSESKWDDKADAAGIKHMLQGEFIGPATYNPKDNSIYFYSQNGLFKGNVNADLSTIDKWKKLTALKLTWQGGRPNAAGSPMNVLKMQFAGNGKLYVLTQNDGIGVLDHGKFRLIE